MRNNLNNYFLFTLTIICEPYVNLELVNYAKYIRKTFYFKTHFTFIIKAQKINCGISL